MAEFSTTEDEDSTIDVSKIPSRLQFFIDNWKEISNNKLILEIIQGYKIPFSKTPFQNEKPKIPDMTDIEFNLLKIAINVLLDKGAIARCKPCKGQFLSSFSLVDKSNGEKRFILNLKKLNLFINAPHFKLEDQKTVMRL